MLMNIQFSDKPVVHFVFLALIFISFGSFAEESILYPENVVAKKGTVSLDQPISVLSVKDQSNSDDNWDNYIDFTPGSKGLVAEFNFNVPQTASGEYNNTSSILKMNYRGWDLNTQKWSVMIYDYLDSKWKFIGDNSKTLSWVWTEMEFTIPNKLSRYVKNDRIKVRYKSDSKLENSLLDYFSLVLESDTSEHVGCNIHDSKKAFSLIENGCLRGANMFQGEQYATKEQVWHPIIALQDLDDLRAKNANYVNFSIPGPYSVEAPYKKRDDFFKKLDQLIVMAEQADLFVILSFRTAPGRGEGDVTAETGSKFNKELFKKKNRRSKRAFVKMWKDVASRYSGNKHIIGYDLLVEPHDINRKTWRNLAQRTINTIRSVDRHTPILISPDDWGVASSLDNWKPLRGNNLVYTVHQYEPYGYTHNNESVNWRGKLESIYSKIEKWVDRYKKPIFINEYGFSIKDDNNSLLGRDLSFMQEQIEHLEKNNFSHAAWIWEVEYDPDYTYQEFDFKDDAGISESIYNSWHKNIIFPSMLQ